MPDHRDDRLTTSDEEIDACPPIAPAPFQTTRTCNKLRAVNWLTNEVI